MKAPCKDCAERTVIPNCHTSCQKYLEYAEDRERVREARRVDHDITSALIRGAEKINREVYRKR